MSENIYRLDLTERERGLLVGTFLGIIFLRRERELETSYEDDMVAKLRALEPIGTGGTTEGNG